MEEIRTVRSPDGTVLAFRSVGSGPDLLLVHGTTSDHTRWRPVLDGLTRHFTVHLLDRRGRGGSGDNGPYGIDREIADIVAVLQSFGGPVAVLAHSFGAICALEAAASVPAVRSLVLYEPPIPTPAAAPAKDAPAIERLEALVAAGRREDALLSFYRDILHAPEAEIDKIRSDSDWPKRIALANTIPRELRAARGYVFDRARFAALTCPVLLVLGGDSPPRYQAATQLLQESLPRCRTAVIGGQRHNAISMAPAAFVATVLGHLTDSVPVPAARQPT